jgi:formylglycine-generating enzyme required for sulfatase activity
MERTAGVMAAILMVLGVCTASLGGAESASTHPTATAPTTAPAPPPTTEPAPPTRPAISAQEAAAAKAEADRARAKAVEALRGLDSPRSFALAEKSMRDAADAEAKAEWQLAVALYQLAQKDYDGARDLVGALTDLVAARAAWTRAVDAVDAALLTRYVAEAFAEIKRTVVLAVDLTPEDPAKAKGLYDQAVRRLAELVAEAKSKEKAEQVAAAVRNVEKHLEAKNWIAGAAALKALSDLAPESATLDGLRQRLADLTPPRRIAVNLGGDVKLEMILVLPGEFTQGSPAGEPGRDDDEGPLRTVRLTRPFYLGVREVSQAEYQKIMFDNPSFYKGADRPVVNVSYRDALLFLKRLTDDARANGHLKPGEVYRLPTEAEWEYACRAGRQTAFCFGDDPKDLADYAWFGRDDKAGTAPVGQKKPNAFGLFDMHGNVWEWCQDYYEQKYPVSDAAAVDPTGPAVGSHRVLRGGSFRDPADQCRSASRKAGWATGVYDDAGFRVLKSIAGPWDQPAPN